jgi:arylsulfatase A
MRSATATLLLFAGVAVEAAAAERPNIVVLYADDLGYGDVHVYNPDRGRIPTPHLDRLATEGMRFTDAHSSSGVCSPSRYTLLTGRYHWRTQLKAGIVNAWDQPLIESNRLTIAGLAKSHGYQTAAIGKWHLGWDWPLEPGDRQLLEQNAKGKARPGPEDVTDAHRAAWQRIFSQPIAGGPIATGFDTYFGTDVPNWPPFCFIENNRTVGIPTTFLPLADFLNHRASNQGPAVEGWHLENVLPALRDRAVAFIETASQAEKPFLLYLPLTSPHTPLAVNEPWRGKSGLENACADLIMETDAVVGDVLAAIERVGAAGTTLVVFTSDNGFAPYVGAAELEQRGHFPSGPLRGYKSDAWEGGHRVPFIVRYPGVVRRGSVCDALVHQADILATLADLLGTELPVDAGEDSVSLMPLLQGGSEPVRRHAVSCSIRGMPAIRDGQWKLILGKGSGGWSNGGDDGPDNQLYDLAADIGERENLAVTQVDRVRAMKAAYERIVAAGHSRPEAAARKPNVIVILADDLGIGDLRATNPKSKIATPALDRLAQEGLVFRDAHTPSSVCTPTRYGLLTGRYNWRSTLARGVLSGTSPPLVPPERPTLGHLLRSTGYHTAMIGKWHLGWNWSRGNSGWHQIDFSQPVTGGPDSNGFDEFCAFSGSLDMPPYVWVENGRPTAVPTREEGVTKHDDAYGWYRSGPIAPDFEITTTLATCFNRSIAHVKRRAAEPDRPFFLYLPLPAPHTPVVPQHPFRGSSGINPYADFVIEVDHRIGELLAALDQAGIADDTLVVFTSDNGCSPEANMPALSEHGHDPSAGFRGHKADIFEGGHRVPLIVRWPAVIAGGRTTDTLACLTDLYATLAAIAGPAESDVGGEDSFSLLPVFQGAESSGRETLVSHSVDGLFAIRRGRWKLCLCGGSGGWSQPTEKAARQRGLPPLQLYDLEADPAETTDRQADQAEIVAELLRHLAAEVQRGRSTPGPTLTNDREVSFLPAGMTLPEE